MCNHLKLKSFQGPCLDDEVTLFAQLICVPSPKTSINICLVLSFPESNT